MTEQDMATKLQNVDASHPYDGDFRTDALEALGIFGNPKSGKVYSLAYEYGHAYGYHEVWNYLRDLAPLIK